MPATNSGGLLAFLFRAELFLLVFGAYVIYTGYRAVTCESAELGGLLGRIFGKWAVRWGWFTIALGALIVSTGLAALLFDFNAEGTALWRLLSS